MEVFTCVYKSIFGNVLLSANYNISTNEQALNGLWFENQKYYCYGIYKGCIIIEKEVEILQKAKTWLDIYFSGVKPDFDVEVNFYGTDFQVKVWNALQKIPYGQVVTYGDIAKQLSLKENKRMSARAVGGAVGRNPISIIVPCHRVVGKNNCLTGYAGGIDKKMELLNLEGIDISKYCKK